MNTTAAHPSREKLEAFGLGMLPAEEGASIEAHVALCDRCCQTLRQVHDDTMIDLARAAHQSSGGSAASRSVRDIQTPAELAEHPRYHVLGPLGVGGMGVVFAAEHRLMKRRVAIKIINRELVANPTAVERFRREVMLAARLNHPNIVQAYDAEQAGDLHFLAMEFVEGTTLARLVLTQGPLAVRQACDFICQAARGLEHARGLGMVHRDIKPHNLMVTPEGQVKILDFGLAVLAKEPRAELRAGGKDPKSVTAVNTVVGTPDYLSPEQARNSHPIDIRADLYALGCTLYFLLTGRPPFADGTALEKMLQQCQDEPPRIETLRADVAPGLAAVVHRLLAKKPADRFQTPADLVTALEPFTAGALTVTRVAPVPPRKPVRRRWWLGASIAGAIFVLVPLLWAVLGNRNGAFNSPKPWAGGGADVLFVLPQKNLHLQDYLPIGREVERVGLKTHVASSAAGPCRADQHGHGKWVLPDRVLDGTVTMDQYDIVVFVGADADEFIGSDTVGQNVARLIREGLTRPGKRVAAICVGQAVPFKHRALDGKQVASSKYFVSWLQDHKEPFPAAITFVPGPVVADGQLITAGVPGDADALGKELARVLRSQEKPK